MSDYWALILLSQYADSSRCPGLYNALSGLGGGGMPDLSSMMKMMGGGGGGGMPNLGGMDLQKMAQMFGGGGGMPGGSGRR